MKDELEHKLYNKYPNLFKERNLPMSQTCMCWGISTGDGWYELLDNMCNAITQTGEDVVFTQVKEKFGTLRVYTNACSNTVHGIVSKAEELSEYICEICGESGELDTRGWWSVRCKQHSKD